MATLTKNLIPNYLDMDFATAKSVLQDLLLSNPVYSQYRVNAEGNNITILIELVAYLTQLCTYYINMVAKNNYISTSELYETTHMLAQLAGYNPQGCRSSRCDLTVTIDVTGADLASGTQLLIPSWKRIFCTDLNHPITGDTIVFNNMVDTSITLSSALSSATLTLIAREGVQRTFTYHGFDIEADYRLYLPIETYDYDDDVDDDISTVTLFVNNSRWTRLSDFYENMSGLVSETEVFMMKIDKYKRYYIEFSPDRSVPKDQDEISIILSKSSGIYGNVPSGSINLPEAKFVYNISNDKWLDNTYVTVVNNDPSVGGADLESVEEIKDNAVGTAHSQFRNVNREDYITFLESRADVIKATVWGEQDISPSGNTADYNKVYISVIPDLWGTNTISTTSGVISGTILTTSYADDWKNTLMEYLEPKKILSTYEEWVLPELIYFSFVIGLKVRTNYTFAEVEADVIAKLQYYFGPTIRKFYDIISYTDIIDYVMDTSIESITNEFPGIRGLQVLTIRDVICDNTSIKEVGSILYPHYMSDPSVTYDNRLKRIQLGWNQFPILNRIICEQEY